MSKKVFVGNLPFSTTEAELQGLFSEHGTVVDVKIPLHRETGRPRGFAFVEFAEESDASNALSAADGLSLGGRELRINPADERPPRSAPRFDMGDMPPPDRRNGKSRRGLRRQK